VARRRGTAKHGALDGATGGGGPLLPALAAKALGVKPQSPAARGVNERVRGGTTTFSPADNAERKERCPESPVRSSPGPGRAWPFGSLRGDFEETEGASGVLAEAGGSTSIEAPLDHAVCQGFGRANGVEAALSSESQGGR